MSQTKPALPETEAYQKAFGRFVKNGANDGPGWLHPVRAAGFARFTELGLPTTDLEDWRYTNLAPLARLPFAPAFDSPGDGISGDQLKTFPFASRAAYQLVFINGRFSPALSELPPSGDQIRVCSLADALRDDDPEARKHLTQHVNGQNEAFSALNTAFLRDGAFVYLPPGAALEKPIHLLYLTNTSQKGAATHPRNLIVAGNRSRLTVLESYGTTLPGPYSTNAVSEFVVGDEAAVEHCKFQNESLEAFHVSYLHAHLGRHCNFISHSIAVGSRLARSHLRTQLAGEGLECTLNGLYLTKGDQLVDHHMIVDHASPRCESHEYFNGILDGRSRGVFHGRILVRPLAQKTDAKQTNKNLLLSDDAAADAKPQLEIYADDVKCTHGATVGQLNEESVFYLRARGISSETARRMLIHAFAGEIIDRIRNDDAREEMDRFVWEHLEQNPLIAERKS